jgi:hypothetical protein
MYTFIVTILISVFILKCFYKKTFWENKEYILLYSICASFITMFIVNMAMRKTFDTETSVRSQEPLTMIYIPNTILNTDTLNIVDSTKTMKISQIGWDFNSHKLVEFKELGHNQTPAHIVLSLKIENDKDTITYINYLNYKQRSIQMSGDIRNFYFIKGTTNKASIVTLYVDTKITSKWVNSLINYPTIDEETFIVLPPKEYDILPKEYITEIPEYFNINVIKNL